MKSVAHIREKNLFSNITPMMILKHWERCMKSEVFNWWTNCFQTEYREPADRAVSRPRASSTNWCPWITCLSPVETRTRSLRCSRRSPWRTRPSIGSLHAIRGTVRAILQMKGNMTVIAISLVVTGHSCRKWRRTIYICDGNCSCIFICLLITV